ncbi:MAG: protein kinase [Thermoanaerobaculia bacterium]|nr:protein kinase [Thermoanaerobaculia bacterium]
MIGQTLSHYRILSKLGEGGMGTVYVAEDERLGREVALKVLSDEWSSDPEHLRRFQREARAVAALDHPNIVTIFSVEEVDGVRFFTMGLVKGETLDKSIPPDGYELDEMLDIAIPMTDALSAAHARGITHRDLKPSNVMLTEDGWVKLLDFGLAKLYDQDVEPTSEEAETEAITRAGVVLGTVPYMSPEQVQGLPVDHRSDIFSLGVIFYELLTGERPFRGESSAALVSSILRDTPREVTRIKASIPARVSGILARCLEKDVRSRFQSVDELREELTKLRQTGSGARAAAEEEEESGPSIAVLPFADMSPDKDQDYFCEGIAEELINGLGAIQGLRVASRTSSFQYKGEALDVREIGKNLGVKTILEGSVRKAGNFLRITAQLVNVADGYRLWSERFDREMKDVFAIQDEITESIVNALEVTLSPKERRALQNVATRNAEAYDFYLRGRKFFYQRSARAMQFALQMFDKAIETDPNYALAYCGKADCCSTLYLHNEATEENRRLADEASAKALELDPDLAEAHASRGLALLLGEDYERAEAEFETAIRLNPKLFEAYYFYARACYTQGKFAKSAQLFEKASEVRPEDYQALLLLRQALIGMGTPPEQVSEASVRALRNVERHLELHPDDVRALYLGANALIYLGNREKAINWAGRALLLEPDDPNVAYNVACVYSQAGEVEKAIDHLERAGGPQGANLAWIERDSDFDPLRDHPRFQALLERLREAEREAEAVPIAEPEQDSGTE